MHSDIFYSTLYANDQQTSSVKEHMVYILGFVGWMISVATTKLYCCSGVYKTSVYNSRDFVHSPKIPQFSHAEQLIPNSKRSN